MNILFFDTETTGKPKNYKLPMSVVENWPRVTQLAYQIANIETSQVHFDVQQIIKPDGWVVPKEQFFIDNNMSTERCEAEGIPLKEVLSVFAKNIGDYEIDIIVAHNMNFDYNVLGAEMIRYGVRSPRPLRKICTMLASTNVCRIPGPYGNKWPSLPELYRHLFACDFDGPHDASFDTTACRLSFFELVKRGHINLSA